VIICHFSLLDSTLKYNDRGSSGMFHYREAVMTQSPGLRAKRATLGQVRILIQPGTGCVRSWNFTPTISGTQPLCGWFFFFAWSQGSSLCSQPWAGGHYRFAVDW